MTSLLLRSRGHVVTAVAEGHSGVAAIERERPDVAFVDVGLPDLSGYDVARRVRSELEVASVLLVALTGYVAERDIRRAVAAGFDHLIAKPASVDALEQAIRFAPRFHGSGVT